MELPDATAIGRIALGDFFRRSALRSRRQVALIDPVRTITYAEMDDQVNRFANFLISTGLTSGSRVATLCNNSVEMLIAIFGIFRAGMTWVPLNTRQARAELAYIVQHAEIGLLIGDAALLDAVSEPPLWRDVPRPPIVTCGVLAGLTTFGEAIASGANTVPEVSIGASDTALIMYTSGTTGRAKGVMHSHTALVVTALATAVELETPRSDVCLALLPLFHCAQFIGTLIALLAGNSIVFMQAFEPRAVLQTIERHRITRMGMLPSMYAALLSHLAHEAFDVSSLRLCTYGMAPMPLPLLEKLQQTLCPRFLLGTGQTEMFPITALFQPGRQTQFTGNYWGEPTLVNDLAIMDEDGTLLPPGEVGEIVHRGPNVMQGYFKDDEATRASRLHGWHHTGDLGLIDDFGQLLFFDRKKDMIKTGGENVPSSKVEEVLLRHETVAGAAIVGLPHPVWVEAVTAFVVATPGSIIDTQSVLEHCGYHLARFETPKAVIIVETLPLTASGKVRKDLLRAAHAAHYQSVPIAAGPSGPAAIAGRI